MKPKRVEDLKKKLLLGWTVNTFKYHVFAPMGRFQLELIYFSPHSDLNSNISSPGQATNKNSKF